MVLRQIFIVAEFMKMIDGVFKIIRPKREMYIVVVNTLPCPEVCSRIFDNMDLQVPYAVPFAFDRKWRARDFLEPQHLFIERTRRRHIRCRNRNMME